MVRIPLFQSVDDLMLEGVLAILGVVILLGFVIEVTVENQSRKLVLISIVSILAVVSSIYVVWTTTRGKSNG